MRRVVVSLVGLLGTAMFGGATALAVAPGAGVNCPAPASATFSSSGAVAITDQPPPLNPGDPPVDTNIVESPITVSGLSGSVLDVDVTTTITHSNNGDLRISLVGPTGKEISLSEFNADGAADSFAGTAWDDQADPTSPADGSSNDRLTADHAYGSGGVASPLVPEESLGAFLDDNPNGTWKLRVWDVRNTGAGTIQAWSVTITTNAEPPGAVGALRTGSGSLLNVVDGGIGSQTITVLGATVDPNVRVKAVTVTMTGVSHADLVDLALYLRSPSGSVVTLTRANDVGTLTGVTLRWLLPSGPVGGASYPTAGFGEPAPITLVPPASQGYRTAPEESLAAFTGQNPHGTWSVIARDLGGVPGGLTIGTTQLSISTFAPCVGDIALTSTGPAAGTKIGRDVTYTSSATVTGSGSVSDVTIRLTPFTLLHPVVTASAGGTCSFNGTGVCVWPGASPPGTVRTVNVTGYLSVASTIGIGSYTNASGNGPSAIARPSNYGPLASVSDPSIKAANGSVCRVVGTQRSDTMPFGVAGTTCGRGGNDVITGSTGRDTIDGGAGNDTIDAGFGKDKVFGGRGNDVIKGGSADDTLDGGPGNDKLDGGKGNDRLIGGLGRDRVTGGAGTDSAKRDGQDRFIGVEKFFTR